MATITETAIANLALSKLGIAPILSLGDEDKRAKVANLWYAHARDAILRSHPWSFAKVRKELAPLVDAPDWGYDYQYQIPANPKSLWVWKAQEGDQYEVEGDKILTDYEELHIVYIKQALDVTKYDALFTIAFSTYLAHQMCFDLTGSRSDEDRLLRATEFALSRASGKSQEESSHEPDTNTEWVDAGHSKT